MSLRESIISKIGIPSNKQAEEALDILCKYAEDEIQSSIEIYVSTMNSRLADLLDVEKVYRIKDIKSSGFLITNWDKKYVSPVNAEGRLFFNREFAEIEKRRVDAMLSGYEFEIIEYLLLPSENIRKINSSLKK